MAHERPLPRVCGLSLLLPSVVVASVVGRGAGVPFFSLPRRRCGQRRESIHDLCWKFDSGSRDPVWREVGLG